MTQDEFRQFLGRYFDGALTPAEMARFDAALRADADARDLFWREAWTEAAVREWGETVRATRQFGLEGPAGCTETDRDASRSRPGGRRMGSLLRPAMAIAAVLLLTVGIWLQGAGKRTSGTSGRRTEAAATSPGSVLDAVGATWADGQILAAGSPLQRKTYRLLSGSARFRLASGAVLWLGDGAELRVESVDRVALSAGRIEARVPASARGFLVSLPGMLVEDLGTEFGVSIDRAGCQQVHVFDGEVRLRPMFVRPADPVRLVAGEARSLAPGDQLLDVPLDYSGFNAAKPADVTVDFDGITTSYRPIGGTYRGIDFGSTGPEGWGVGPWKGEMAVDIHADARSATQQFRLPLGTTLKRLRMQSDLGAATVTLRSAGNPDVVFKNILPAYSDFRTDWTGPSPVVSVSVSSPRAASDVDIVELTYGPP